MPNKLRLALCKGVNAECVRLRQRRGWAAFAGAPSLGYERSMVHFSRIAGFVILTVIALVTLCPIDLRPETGHATLERMAAFLLLGLALGMGFPRRAFSSSVFVIAVAVLLEALQTIDPGRHARFMDMAVKAAAGVAGVAVAWLVTKLRDRLTVRWRAARLDARSSASERPHQ
jgi:VanZ family protein